MTPAQRENVARRARNLCEYCQAPQFYTNASFHIEHIHPVSLGGTDETENLAWCCPSCNAHKAARIAALDPATLEFVRLFHPRRDRWDEHFRWEESGLLIEAISAIGRATALLLDFNRMENVRLRYVLILGNDHPRDTL